jgi:D-alanyl-D-alanine carboxypeptidase/D-alanyl-D-alanine-endopeptidase (penicillin-binding protein 4)
VAAACPSFSDLIRNGSYGVANRDGVIISGCNLDTPFVPASILKIATALAGFELLGSDFRFSTFFYTDNRNNLYIKGTGDPLLVSEEVARIFIALQARGVERINSIFIDPSLFALEHQVPGRENSGNPYDAPVGPVVVNFNSVPVEVTKKRNVISSEPQTPTLPIMRQVAKNYLPGKYRINVCIGSCNPDRQMARYTAELFRAMQQKAGIPGSGSEGIRQVPPTARLVYVHKNSKDLEYLTGSFLKYSSNFISNLVYLACGAKRFGYPATWNKANRAVHEVLARALGKERADRIVHVEGAGLSRQNRISARTMLTLLETFRPHAGLLRRRMGVLTKSGSLKGVYNYAGYLPDGKTYVILLNQQRNTRRAVLSRLKKGRYPVAEKERQR